MRGDGDALSTRRRCTRRSHLAVGDDDGTVIVPRRPHATAARRTAPDRARSRGSTSLAFSPDGSRLASAGWDAQRRLRRAVRRARPAAHSPAWTHGRSARDLGVEACSFSAGLPGAGAADAGLRGRAHRRRCAGTPGRDVLLGGVRRHPGPVTRRARLRRCSAARDVQRGGSRDGHPRRRARLRPLRAFPVAARSAPSSRGRGRLAFGSADGSVRLLDLRTGRVRTAAGGHDGAVSGMRFSPDGGRLVTAGRDERLIVWDTAPGDGDRDARRARPRSGDRRSRSRPTAGPPTAPAATAPSSPGTWPVRGVSSARSHGRRIAGRRARWRRRPSGSPLAVLDENGRRRRVRRPLAAPGTAASGPAAGAPRDAASPDGATLATMTDRGRLDFWDLPDASAVAGAADRPRAPRTR